MGNLKHSFLVDELFGDKLAKCPSLRSPGRTRKILAKKHPSMKPSYPVS
jgi:hypothetical protein